jgi:hypothetical protein
MAQQVIEELQSSHRLDELTGMKLFSAYNIALHTRYAGYTLLPRQLQGIAKCVKTEPCYIVGMHLLAYEQRRVQPYLVATPPCVAIWSVANTPRFVRGVHLEL